MSEFVIETKQISKVYGANRALHQVSLHIKKGCIYGLIGDNGAGKSTLLKMIAGLCYASEGEIHILGKTGKRDLENARRNIGCLIENPGFFPNMSIEQTLYYYCIQKGIPDRNKVDEVLRLTGLMHIRKQKGGFLSLGQKQRLGLAIAMIGEPQILILDEPINGLDPSGMIEFRHLLHRLNEEKHMTILLSSHILPELQQIATMYGFLNHGVLIEEIDAQTLQERCMDCIEMITSDVASYAAIFETAFPTETYKILPNNIFRIYTPKQTPEAYSKLAFEHCIYITGMQAKQSSLEDYYMNLKERGGKQC